MDLLAGRRPAGNNLKMSPTAFARVHQLFALADIAGRRMVASRRDRLPTTAASAAVAPGARSTRGAGSATSADLTLQGGIKSDAGH